MKTLAALALGAAAVAASAEGVSGSAVAAAGGRYALGQISSSRGDQFLLDTQTGRIWRVVCMTGESPSCRGVALQPVSFVDATGNPAGFQPVPEQSTQRR